MRWCLGREASGLKEVTSSGTTFILEYSAKTQSRQSYCGLGINNYTLAPASSTFDPTNLPNLPFVLVIYPS